MRRASQSPGYTIVEVMIFLTISAALFVGAITMIGGRQRSTQFAQSLQELDSSINDVLNTVATGFYPSHNNFDCTVNNPANPTSRPLLQPGTNEQGSNGPCVFVGKIMQFGLNNGAQFKVYTIIGRRQTPDGTGGYRLATAPDEINPIVGIRTGLVDLSETHDLQWGVVTDDTNLASMVYTDSAGNHPTGALGFFTTFGQYSPTSNDPVSGAQQVNLITLNTTNITTDSTTFITAVNSAATTGSYVFNPSGGVTVCLTGPYQGQKASIAIGISNHRLGTDPKIGQRAGICP